MTTFGKSGAMQCTVPLCAKRYTAFVAWSRRTPSDHLAMARVVRLTAHDDFAQSRHDDSNSPLSTLRKVVHRFQCAVAVRSRRPLCDGESGARLVRVTTLSKVMRTAPADDFWQKWSPGVTRTARGCGGERSRTPNQTALRKVVIRNERHNTQPKSGHCQ